MNTTNKNFISFLSPIDIAGLTVKNRVVMAPMCMFCACADGLATDFHQAHYISRAAGGVGMIIVEATAVRGNGRISSADLGIWDDAQIEGLQRLATGIKQAGSVAAIQLGHAGAKCLADNENDIISPGGIRFSEKNFPSRQMTVGDIVSVIDDFRAAAKRALAAGFQMIELHGAHGYLIHQFLSPLCNRRDDQYGGSLQNRSRFLAELLEAVRADWPLPIVLRLSGSDHHPNGNQPADVAAIVNRVKDLGINLINVSSGGAVPETPLSYSGFQIPFATEIKRLTNLPVIGGGLLSEYRQVEQVIGNNEADMVFLGRALLRQPAWVYNAAAALGYPDAIPQSYRRAYPELNK